jgi:hypothetical protein
LRQALHAKSVSITPQPPFSISQTLVIGIDPPNTKSLHIPSLHPKLSHRASQTVLFMIKALDLLAHQLLGGQITRASYQQLKRPVLASLHRSLASRMATLWEDPFLLLEGSEEGRRVGAAMAGAGDELGREEFGVWWERCLERGGEKEVVTNVAMHFIDGYAL